MNSRQRTGARGNKVLVLCAGALVAAGIFAGIFGVQFPDSWKAQAQAATNQVSQNISDAVAPLPDDSATHRATTTAESDLVDVPGDWVIAGSPEAALRPPAQGWDPAFVPSEAQKVEAVDILTRTGDGTDSRRRTMRFSQGTVTVRFEDGIDPGMAASARSALTWDSSITGLHFVETAGSADVVVRPRGENSGTTETYTDGRGNITHIDVWLGCCRERVAWEEISQLPGAVGDYGTTDSVFSEARNLIRPSAFDAWVLHELYTMPVGLSSDAVRARLG